MELWLEEVLLWTGVVAPGKVNDRKCRKMKSIIDENATPMMRSMIAIRS